MENKTYICIDLKSFFASVECVERGLNPFDTNLVVADPERGQGTICLAVSPAMKALGVPGRCRVYEIPKNISFIKAPPRLDLYMKKSEQIFGIYLRYVSPDDLHIYSIDECFIDATDYLRFYGKTAKEFADMLRGAVFAETGICATAGVGTNLFLSKVALDIVAKHVPDHVGILDEARFREKIWHHKPITDIWNIGPATAKKLAHYGVYDLHGITLLPTEVLFRAFGVNAATLLDHAWGREKCTIADIKAYIPKSTSMSHGQVLLRDYTAEEAELILMEMTEKLTLELVRKKQRTGEVGLTVSYSKNMLRPLGKSLTLREPTQSYRKLSSLLRAVYRENISGEYPIRKIEVSFGRLCDESDAQIGFFDEPIAEEREHSMLVTINRLHDRYGKNSVVRARDFQDCATAMERNRKATCRPARNFSFV